MTVVLAVTVAMFLSFAGAAFAAAYYHNGPLGPRGLDNGPDVYLKQNTARKLDSVNSQICIQAVDSDTGGRVGQPDCTNSYQGLAAHDYCACQFRRPILFNQGTGTTSVRAQYFILGD